MKAVSVKLSDEQLQMPAEEVFEIVAKIGSGSYGDVYKAIDKQYNHPYAVKKISANTDLREIVKEVSVMQECDSPFIVRYFGSFSSSSSLWIVMEFCGVGSVSDMMKLLHRPLPEPAIGSVMADALRGLAYLHERRRIHRDVKAGNILLTEDGHAKIADFGVAGKLSETLHKFETMIGSPLWMAPEVLGNAGYELPADIWSLGITAIEMAEEKPPLSDLHPIRAIFAIPNQDPPQLKEPEKWSSDFLDFVSSCLQKDPAKRPTSSHLSSTHAFVHKFTTENRPPACLLEMIAECLFIRRNLYAELLAQKKHHSHPQGPSSGELWEYGPYGEARASAPAAIGLPGVEDPNAWLYSQQGGYGSGNVVIPSGRLSCCSQSPSNTSSLVSGHSSFAGMSGSSCPTRPFKLEDLNNPDFFSNMSETELKRRIDDYESALSAEVAWLRRKFEAKRRPLVMAIRSKQQQIDQFLMPQQQQQNTGDFS